MFLINEKFSIQAETNYSKETLTKDKTGNTTQYKLNASVTFLIKNEKLFCANEFYYGKVVPFVQTFVCQHPVYQWPKTFDLKPALERIS